MSTTTIRVPERTRRQVAALAHGAGVSQSSYLEQLVAERAAAKWEADFWLQMNSQAYDDDDWAALAEQEAAYDEDFGAVQ
jgi:predicted alpha/beta-hydrolase family hydrolase